MVTRLVALKPSPACEPWQPDQDGLQGVCLQSIARLMAKKNNAADRMSPVDHRPQRLIQRVFEGSAHANTQLKLALRSKGLIGDYWVPDSNFLSGGADGECGAVGYAQPLKPASCCQFRYQIGL